jgi:hypothetical protein
LISTPDTLAPVTQPRHLLSRYQASAPTVNGGRTPVLPHCHPRAAAAIPSSLVNHRDPVTDRESGLADSQALATRTTRWLLATQARLGMTGEARALLAALDDERASSGEIRNARAVICLAEGDPAGALAAVAGVLDGTAPVLGCRADREGRLRNGRDTWRASQSSKSRRPAATAAGSHNHRNQVTAPHLDGH